MVFGGIEADARPDNGMAQSVGRLVIKLVGQGRGPWTSLIRIPRMKMTSKCAGSSASSQKPGFPNALCKAARLSLLTGR